MQTYLYSLIRYVPVMERMEPINVGVILQGEGLLDVRLSPHAAKRKEIDTQVFRKWREFFIEEIRNDPTPLFQPEKTSPQFLAYLAQLCEGPVMVSRALTVEIAPPRHFKDVIDELYNRLVAPPEATSPVEARRPTGRFRQLTEDRQFLKRGMQRHTHVVVADRPLWTAYRQVCNGHPIAIDKIEIDTRIGATANEIERVPRILEGLPTFLRPGQAGEYYLLADELQKPFSDQSEVEFKRMRDELEEAVAKVEKAGGQVLRNIHKTEALANQIDRVLPALPAAGEPE
jgi:Protein of unknown function (DUF3037)